MPADDPQSYDTQPRLWARQQPLYIYPQPPEDGSHLDPSPVTHHEHSSNIGLSSFDYGPSYDQISQSSSLVPSSAQQYPPADSSQVPYAPYSNPGYGRHQPSHDYYAGPQHAFHPRVPAMTNPPYPTSPASSAYTSPAFPHQLSELGQARDYGAQGSIPTVTTPDAVAPAFSAFDASYYHTHASPSNKRQRPEDQEEDVGDVTDQTRGHALQLSTAEKLKRACARCRGLKVRCHFKDDNDTCDRCIKASQECIIPGRRQRRPPPKREILLAKIRDQAAQIKDLMAQLEAIQLTDRNVTQMTTSLHTEFAHSSILGSPGSGTLADSFGHSLEAASTLDTSSSASRADSMISQENLEWIAKARESLEAFGASIRLGSSSTAKKDLVDQDLEDSTSSEGDYHLANEGSGSEEELDIGHLPPKGRGPMRERGLPGKTSPSGAKMVGLPGQASPFGMMAALSVGHARTKKPASVASDVSDLGVANENFFRAPVDPDPMRLRPPGHRIPPLLRKNIITSVEAEKLFKIYFDWMNISVSLLDPKLYTAQQVYWRCPFLFTVICAIASRYDTERPDLYPTAMDSARQEAGAAFLICQKRVEVVQAYYLLSLYPIPARRWEEDRSWIYLGQAIRVAMDMNLHHPNTAKPRDELHAREMLNRTRAWLNVYNLDRSFGSQYGKMAIISNADYVANHSHEWWKTSEYNIENFDIHTCSYNAELRLLSGFLMKVYSNPEHPTGLNKEIDLGLLASETDDKIEELRQQWFSKFKQTDSNEPQNRFRIGLLRLAYSYARLVALAFGFQHAFGKSNTDENPFLKRCIRAASDVVSAMVDDIGRPSQRIFVRHGPESQTVFVAFSCVFLIKLLQPKHASYLSSEQRAEIARNVERAIEFLGSPDIGVDDRHGPRLYSRFLRGLFERVKTPAAQAPRSSRSKRKISGQPTPELRANLHPTQAMKPVAVDHFEPIPAQASTPFDHFAWPIEADVDPSASADTSALGLHASEFFYAPLPFDRDLVESMQSLSSLSEMHDATLPGFAWMKQMPPVDFGQYPQQTGNVFMFDRGA